MITQKGNFDGLHKHARWVFGGAELPKKEILHNQIVGIYFQKRKDFLVFTGKKLPKKENLMAYVSRPWENISKKGKSVNFPQKKYFQKRKFLMAYVSVRKYSQKKEILMDYVIISYYTQMNRTNWLYSMVTTAGFSMAYLSRLLSLTKPNLTWP